MKTWIARGALVSFLAGCAAEPPRGGTGVEPEPEEPEEPTPMSPPKTGGTGGNPAPSLQKDAGESGAGGTGGSAAGGAGGTGGGGEGGSAPDGGADAKGAGTDASGVEAGPPAADCPGGKHMLCEDFEGATVGALPAGWTKDGAVSAVADDGAHAGKQSLKVTDATFWHRRIARKTAIPGTHWGRVFYKVRTPAPRPGSGVVHSTFVTLTGTSPLGGTAEWRVVDTVLNSGGTHQFLYNVQTTGRGEFGKGSSYNWSYDGKWHCAEWRIDAATQSYQFFIDGNEVKQIAINNGAGNYKGSEIPKSFTAVKVGWSNFQRISPGFAGWFDDVAIDSKRIGCE